MGDGGGGGGRREEVDSGEVKVQKEERGKKGKVRIS